MEEHNDDELVEHLVEVLGGIDRVMRIASEEGNYNLVSYFMTKGIGQDTLNQCVRLAAMHNRKEIVELLLRKSN